MTREQRYRYRMFVRVRDFGAANQELFPETSTGGQAFATVAAAIAAVADHMKKRDIARANAQRVQATTRAAVWQRMKVVAHTARRAVTIEGGANPFKMPSRSSTDVVLARARVFIEEAEGWRDAFVALGLRPTFIDDLRALADRLEAAAGVQINSRPLRRQAQAGIETALVEGFEAIRTLDVVVVNALLDDPVRFAGWQGARRIEGQGTSSPAAVTIPAQATVAAPDDQSSPAMPADALDHTEATHDALVPVQPDDALRRAS